MNAEKLFFPDPQMRFNDLKNWEPLLKDQEKKRSSSSASPKKPPTTLRESFESDEDGRREGNVTEVNGNRVAIFRHGKNLFGIQANCPHAGGPLYKGDIEELPDGSLCIRCPWHSWCFQLSTGKCIWPSGQNDVTVTVYPVHRRKSDQAVLVGFDSFHKKYFSDRDF
ncbi:unnamed protein product [Darwinula stevensoni]|uniref:Rieske domain-containing protein n=1 Tax=Darwinula stevensoni TaxID=69355 RepID=A0A7R8XBZ2_9CRUS|nr:unnamed protein product [Darwinula stevensoni]CAG0887144.1 unnamed protein product [Darwinula stevensoni]